MSRLNYSIDLLQNTYGITCIENQFISALKYLNAPYQAAYVESYIDLYDTVLSFYKLQIEYSYYKGLDRVQVVSSKLDFAEINSQEESFSNMLITLEHSIHRGCPIFIHVDPKKLPRSGEIIPWREDHFIALYGLEQKTIYALDDVPRRLIELSYEAVHEAYQGTVIELKLLAGLNRSSYLEKCRDQMKFIASQSKRLPYWNIDDMLQFDEKSIVYLRDALGIVRISRRRIIAWLHWLAGEYGIRIVGIQEDLATVINSLDRLYAMVEMYRLRNKINYKFINDQFEEMVNLEMAWIIKLNEEGIHG
ncbi:hypothetical protein [Paenibacillus mesotrionivorans]|jgi:hypothetical protein|uniref:Uncharacterized protein n=1 Tax=Paenibacillus mesotrionivorans TaxID=3160968 RepID=A0ACC7NTI3_9BACL